MITTAQTLTLLASIVLISLVCTAVWLALALAARIAPRASLAMAGANAAVAVSLALHSLRGVLPDAATYWPGDVLAVAAFALLRAAVPAVASREPAWRVGLAVTLGAALLLLLMPYGGDLRWHARLINGACALLTLLAALDAWRHLGEAGVRRRNVWLLAGPLFLIAALMALRGLESVLNPGSTQDMRVPSAFNLAFLWGALVLTVLQNATLAFLVLMRLILRIRRLTERDPLTDVLNRRAFGDALARAHAWHQRGRGYALVMIDMDRFKRLNDSLGHAAGDAALQQLVARLAPCLRSVDGLGRLGGEEFCALLPDTDLAGAALVAERMRMLLDAAPLAWQGQAHPLSASFGIAEAERGDASAEAVLARADAALYRAKHQGRNLVQA